MSPVMFKEVSYRKVFFDYHYICMGKDALADVVGGARRGFIVSDPFMVSSGKISYCHRLSSGDGARIVEFKPDHVVVLGGGFPIDSAKTIVFFAHQHGLSPCPLTVILTTSGTGSSVSGLAVITDHNKELID